MPSPEELRLDAACLAYSKVVHDYNNARSAISADYLYTAARYRRHDLGRVAKIYFDVRTKNFARVEAAAAALALAEAELIAAVHAYLTSSPT